MNFTCSAYILGSLSKLVITPETVKRSLSRYSEASTSIIRDLDLTGFEKNSLFFEINSKLVEVVRLPYVAVIW